MTDVASRVTAMASFVALVLVFVTSYKAIVLMFQFTRVLAYYYSTTREVAVSLLCRRRMVSPQASLAYRLAAWEWKIVERFYLAYSFPVGSTVLATPFGFTKLRRKMFHNRRVNVELYVRSSKLQYLQYAKKTLIRSHVKVTKSILQHSSIVLPLTSSMSCVLSHRARFLARCYLSCRPTWRIWPTLLHSTA